MRTTGIDIRDLGIETTMEGLYSRTPVELQTLLEAERSGAPFLVLRRGGVQVIHVLPPEGRVTLGREVACDLAFVDDHEVSRLHAELERVGGHWVLADHGLSRNGTFLNGERLQGERTLHDGDTVRIGASQFVYRAPDESPARPTEPAAGAEAAESLTPTQRAVLAALCRPYKDASPFATPASNQAIAEEVGLSVPRVKAHLTDLYERLGVGDLPHNAKRAKLVETAFQRGALSVRDL